MACLFFVFCFLRFLEPFHGWKSIWVDVGFFCVVPAHVFKSQIPKLLHVP